MKHERQKKAYDFLQSRVNATFKLSELASAADWKPKSASTYISKHLKGLVEKVRGADEYRVQREFRRFTLEQYTRIANQTRRVFQTYNRDEFGGIVTFEFLLPLTQETKLRRALDDIFYLDTVVYVLEELGLQKFEQWVSRSKSESDNQYANKLAVEADKFFGGYSVSHVQGRFRAASLLTRADAGELFAKDRQYLADETTASVRFIIPLSTTTVTRSKAEAVQLLLPMAPVDENQRATILEEIEFVRELFFCLFVEALIRNVTGEDEIWLIEHSPGGRRLHVWRPDA